MAAGRKLGRCYRLMAALLDGQELDRRAVEKLIGVRVAAADQHINAVLAEVPGVESRRSGNRRMIRFTGDGARGAATRNLAAAACFGASLARLFRGSSYEALLDQLRTDVIRRVKTRRDFGDARRKFLFISQADEVALPDREALLDDLVEAVLKQQRAQIEYTGFDGSERSVEISPWSIAIYEHQLYVLAEGESSALRAYRLSRIRDVRVRSKTFKYPERSVYDPEHLFRDTFGIFVRGEHPVEEVVMRLAAKWSTYARTHVWHSSQRVSHEADGGVLLRLRVRTCDEFERFVLGFGDEAEVVEPASFRARIAARVQAAYRRYSVGEAHGVCTTPPPHRQEGRKRSGRAGGTATARAKRPTSTLSSSRVRAAPTAGKSGKRSMLK
jgi:predicted DNA-binding transcriptional regulator YafY